MRGMWSRRIDEVNRIVYSVKDEIVYVLSCKGHYRALGTAKPNVVKICRWYWKDLVLHGLL
nr:type II toxin-antitoxin system YoeB family toxin [uncultured Oribacterium sp.]